MLALEVLLLGNTPVRSKLGWLVTLELQDHWLFLSTREF